MNFEITNADTNTESPETKPVAPIRETDLMTNLATSCISSRKDVFSSIRRGFCGESRLLT